MIVESTGIRLYLRYNSTGIVSNMRVCSVCVNLPQYDGEECEASIAIYMVVGGMGNMYRDVNLQNEVLLPQYCVIVLSFMSIKT